MKTIEHVGSGSTYWHLWFKDVTYENYPKLIVKEKEKLKKALEDLNPSSLSSLELPGTPCFNLSDYFSCNELETLFKKGFDFFLI